jgi:C4-dicarboxylate-specific signal transduction histidine kinase
LDRLFQLRLNETFTIAAFPSMRAFAASDPTTRAQRAAVALNELQAWVAADTQLREAFVVDLKGATILTTNKEWNQNWKTRPFIQNALAGKLDLSAPSRDLGEFSQYYAAPILDNRREIVGALVARIAAQELWSAVGSSASSYAVLTDENGVRLADGGDMSRNLVAWAALSPEKQNRVVSEQTYGSQVTLLRTTNFPHAEQLLTSGALNVILPADFGADAVGAQRLTSKPWTVLVIALTPSSSQTLSTFLLPLGAGLFLALVGALITSR